MIEMFLLLIMFIAGAFFGVAIMACVSITRIVRLETELNILREGTAENGNE